MARLQRKKTSTGLKKKKTSIDAVQRNGANGSAGAGQTALPTPTVRDARKKRALSARRTASGPVAEPGKIRGYWDKTVQFLREVKMELKKVTWPSRQQTMGSTVVVLILVMIISFFLGMADIALSGLIRVVLQ